jgi:hypothetical protein
LLPTIDPNSQAASLRAMEEYYRSLSDAEREHLAAEREHLALVYRLTKRARHRTDSDATDAPLAGRSPRINEGRCPRPPSAPEGSL